MQINNPLQINDWGIGKFLKVVLAIQLAMLGVIGLDAIGLQIPILRQLIGFIYLTFIPGIIILRILKLHKLGNIETILYTVGLSIATLMFTGLLMNTVYPLFGISGPISIVPLIITISVVVLILCIISYIRDQDFSDPSFIEVGEILSPLLFLCLIPFLAVFGTYLVNFHHNNILLMLMIVVIASIVLLIAFDKFIPKKLYPLAIFVIAISLLYHNSLISMYLTGWDIHIEYYLSNLVMGNFQWDLTLHSNVNAMLSIVMLAPIFSEICNLNLTWVFKIIYPLLFALVPLGLYRVYQKQTDDRIAFLSCFFFTAYFEFWMLSSRRQWIAEFFLVLLILAMIDKDMNKIKRSLLFIVFGVSLVVSHYGTSYIYMFCLISAWLILLSGENPTMQRLRNNFHAKFGRNKREKPVGNPISSNAKNRTIRSTCVLFFIVFALTWYMYVSSSSAFNTIVRIGDHMASSIFTEFLNPEAAQGLGIILKETVSPLHSVAKYLHLLSQFFIAVGILTVILKRSEMKFEKEYTAFAVSTFVICFFCIAVPHFTAMKTARLYHVVLIFLAPFCVIGAITLFKMLSRIVRASWTNESARSSLKVLSVFLVIFLLFNSGFVYEVAKDRPGSIALSQESCKTSKNIEDRAALFNGLNVFEQDVYSTRWFDHNVDQGADTKVYVDCTSSHPLVSYGMTPLEHQRMLSNTTTKIEYGAFVFLGYPNVVENVARERSGGLPVFNTTELSPFLRSIDKIYTNGGSEIYRGEK